MDSVKVVTLLVLGVCVCYHPVAASVNLSSPCWKDYRFYIDHINVAYINQPTYYKIVHTCKYETDICRTSCDMEHPLKYLYLTKDKDPVYAKVGPAGNTTEVQSGIQPGYEGKVVMDESEADHGEYNLTWLQNTWEDLPKQLEPGVHRPTAWRLIAERTHAGNHVTVILKVDYAKHPVLTYYAEGDVVEEYSAVKDITDGTVNCTVLSHPTTSRLTLMQGSEVLSNSSSCAPFSVFESVCSISVSNVNLNMGFHCVVEYGYASHKYGSFEPVTPDGCCPSGIYPPWPQTTNTDQSGSLTTVANNNGNNVVTTSSPPGGPAAQTQNADVSSIAIGVVVAIVIIVVVGLVVWKLVKKRSKKGDTIGKEPLEDGAATATEL